MWRLTERDAITWNKRETKEERARERGERMSVSKCVTVEHRNDL